MIFALKVLLQAIMIFGAAAVGILILFWPAIFISPIAELIYLVALVSIIIATIIVQEKIEKE